MTTTRNGKARNRSVTRIMKSSNLPPRRPAKAPTAVPISTARIAEAMPMNSDVRMPYEQPAVHVAPDVVGAEPGDLLRREEHVVPLVDLDDLLVDAVPRRDRRGEHDDHHDRRARSSRSPRPCGASSASTPCGVATWSREAARSSPTVLPGDAARQACSVVSALVKADPRVEVGVQDVGEQVEQDHGDRDDHQERHQLREVADRRRRRRSTRPCPGS